MKKIYQCVIILSLSNSLYAQSVKVVFTPFKKLYARSQKQVTVVIPNASTVKQANFFYFFKRSKKVSEKDYQSLESIKLTRKGTRFSGMLNIPGDKKGSQFFYFLRIQLIKDDLYMPQRKRIQDSEKFEYSFYNAGIEADIKGPKIILVSPKKNEEISGQGVQIKYLIRDLESGINKKSIRFLFNGNDFSRGVILKDNSLIFRLEEGLPKGKYGHSLFVKDHAGNLSESKDNGFIVLGKSDVRLKEELSKKSWEGNGDISFNYDSNFELKSKKSWNGNTAEDNARKTFNFRYDVKKDDAKFLIGPAIITSSESTPGNRNSKLSFEIEKSIFKTKWGDITSDVITWTSAQYLVGGYLSLGSTKNSLIKISGGETQKGYDSQADGVAGKFSRNSFQGYLGYNFNKNNMLFTAAQYSEDQEGSITDTKGIEPEKFYIGELGYKGTLFNSLVFSSKFGTRVGEDGRIVEPELREQSFWITNDIQGNIKSIGTNVGVNYGLSHSAKEGRRQGTMLGYNTRVTASKNIKAISLNLSTIYEETSPSFVVLNIEANPSSQRKGSINGNMNLWKGLFTLNSNNVYSVDNIKNRMSQTTETFNFTNGLSFNLKEYPGFNYTNSYILKKSSGTVGTKVRNETNSNTLGLIYNFEIWKKKQNININFSFINVKDQSEPAQGSDSRNLGVNSNYRINLTKDFLLGINYSRNESKNLESGDRNINETYAPNINIYFFKKQLTQTFNLSRNKSTSIMASNNQTSINISYALGMSTQASILNKLNLNFNFNYSKSTVDKDSLNSIYPGGLTFSIQFNLKF